MPPLKQVILAVIGGVLRFLAGRWLAPKQVSEGTYEAKAAEAKELAKPDDSWDDTVNKL